MAKQYRKALAWSCILHFLLLAGVGGLAKNGLSEANAPGIVELELVSEAPNKNIAHANATLLTNTKGKTGNFHSVSQSSVMHEAVQLPQEQAIAEPATLAENLPAPANGGSEPKGQNTTPPGSPYPVVSTTGTASGVSLTTRESVSAAQQPRVITPPRVFSRVEPEYPEQARREGREGIVGLRLEVSEDGTVSTVTVAASSGYGDIDRAAVQAVEKWRFIPASDRAAGVSVACATRLSLRFNLQS